MAGLSKTNDFLQFSLALVWFVRFHDAVQNWFHVFIKIFASQIKNVPKTFGKKPLLPKVIQIFCPFNPVAFLAPQKDFYIKKPKTPFFSR
jgi:hypothetical protein